MMHKVWIFIRCSISIIQFWGFFLPLLNLVIMVLFRK